MPLRLNPATTLTDESVIREMMRVAEDCGAVNLAQGVAEMPVPAPVLEAARRAIAEGKNCYTRTWGAPSARARRLSPRCTRCWSDPVFSALLRWK